jgi:RNA polymerase-binding transcription factor DksA
MSVYVTVPARDTGRGALLSVDDLDSLRGLLLAERAAALGRIAEHEALLFAAPADAFGAELCRFAKASIARAREAVADVDEALERLVETHGSCEWCETMIPPEQRELIPPGRLCRNCRRR